MFSQGRERVHQEQMGQNIVFRFTSRKFRIDFEQKFSDWKDTPRKVSLFKINSQESYLNFTINFSWVKRINLLLSSLKMSRKLRYLDTLELNSSKIWKRLMRLENVKKYSNLINPLESFLQCSTFFVFEFGHIFIRWFCYLNMLKFPLSQLLFQNFEQKHQINLLTSLTSYWCLYC